MQLIQADKYQVEVGSLVESSFSTLLKENYSKSKKVIVVDDNTRQFCLEYLITNFDELTDAEVIQLPSGEENKHLEIVSSVWEALTEYGVSRYDVIINLGGGLVSDMGGFIAACYKRGVDCINVPTSLLAMVDASIGGKTGVNLAFYKNQIGVFSNPVALFVDPSFLQTLPDEELISGYAEMLKHGLISDKKLFTTIIEQLEDPFALNEDLLVECIEVKNKVVTEDPFEKGKRKVLNFGHTIGHVIEGHFMDKYNLSHGYCVAIGMIMEAYLSMTKSKLSLEEYNLISATLFKYYALVEFTDEDIREMIVLLENDKKNSEGKIKCCLLEKIGNCSFDNVVSEEEFLSVFMHFKNMHLNLN